MKRSTNYVASLAIAILSTGAVAGAGLLVSAEPSVAKSENAGGKGKGASNKNSKAKANGQWRSEHARYLKNLNAMCSNGKSQSPESNVYRINAYYSAQTAVDDWADEKAAAESELYVIYGDAYKDEAFDIDQEIAYETAFEPDPNINLVLKALLDYKTAVDLEAAQHDALVLAVRDEDRAAAFMEATDGPLYEAFEVFKAGCKTK